MKTVSVVIPAKNEEKYLPFCLASIQKLDYPKEFLEMIVVDNGSTDRTREIAASFGAKVLRDDTKHVSGLRNLGAKAAKGEMLAFLDADCTVEPDWLQAASRYFDADDVVAWGAPPGIPADATWVQRAWYLIRKKEHEVQVVDWLESMNLFVEKKFLLVAGFSEELITCEDVDLSYRLAAHGRIVADARIRAIHHGEAATLCQFWRKELWRGLGNFQGLHTHGLSWSELPSLMVPLYFSTLIVSLVLSLVISFQYTLIVLILFFFPGLFFLIKKRKKGTLRDLMTVAPLLYLYFIARTASSVMYLYRLSKT